MCIKIGPEFHSLEEEDVRNDVYKKGPNIQFGQIRSEFQCI